MRGATQDRSAPGARRAALGTAVLAACLALLTRPLAAAPLIEPASPLDLPSDDRAESTQGPALVAGGSGDAMGLYWDARDERVHAVGLDGVTPGASRWSLVLDQPTDLDDAALSGGPADFLLTWAVDGGIWARRLTLDGGLVTPLGDAIAIAAADGFTHPRAAYGPCGWLVAYRDGVDTGPVRLTCLTDSDSLYAVPAAAVADAAAFELGSFHLGGDYALIHVTLGAADHVEVSRIDVTGGVASTTRLTVGQLTEPDVSLGASIRGEVGRVIWFADGGPLFGRTFDSAFAAVGSGVEVLSPLGESSITQASVVVTDGDARLFLIDGGELRARTWDAPFEDAQVVAEAPAADPTSAVADEVALGVYSVGEVGARDVVMRRLTVPELGVPIPVTVGTAPRESAAATFGNGRYTVVWSAPARAADADVTLRLVDGDGVPLGAQTPVATSSADETSVAVAQVDGVALVVWIEDGLTLKGRRYAIDSGTPTPAGDASTICHLDGGLRWPTAIPLAQVEADFLVAWQDVGAGQLGVVGFGTDGPTVACGVEATTDPVEHRDPVFATDGGVAMLAWVEGEPGAVRARTVDSTLALGPSFELVESVAGVSEIDLASPGVDSWMLASVRVDAVDGGRDLVLTPFGSDGTAQSDVPLPAGTADDADGSPRLWAGDGRTSVVWHRQSTDSLETAQIEAGAIVTDSRAGVVGAPVLIGGPLGVAGSSVDRIAVLARELDSSGTRQDERLVVRSIRFDGGPVAAAGGPYLAPEGAEISFDGSGSAAAAGRSLVSWQWRLDDTLIGTEQSFTLTFTDDATSQLVLEVEDDAGATDRDTALVIVTNVAPSLALVGAPYALFEGDVTPFSVAWDDPGDDEVTLTWSFGDGSVESGPAGDTDLIEHTYAQGDYELCVTAEDDDGAGSTQCTSVSVANRAPTVVLAEPSSVAEGSLLAIGVDIGDPGDDPLDVHIDYGDGTGETLPAVTSPYIESVSHAWADDFLPGVAASPFLLCVRVQDTDGAEATDCVDVAVANVGPIFDGLTPALALEGLTEGGEPVAYQAVLDMLDPGTDDIAVGFTSGGLPGVTADLSTDGRTLTVSFVPTLDQWRLLDPPTWTFRVDVDDGGFMGTATRTWDVTIVPLDENADGLPDTCADAYGVTEGGAADSDGDGLSNLAECRLGTDPGRDDRPPSAPSLNAPADGAIVDVLTPTLSITNVAGPEGASYQYAFELYDSPGLGVDDRVGEAVVPGGAGITTAWNPGALSDGVTYYWRARAAASVFAGPWMDVATFTVALPNAMPSQPIGLEPEGVVRTATPTFEWAASTDADGDVLTYRLEVFDDATLAERVRLVEGIAAAGETVSYEPEETFSLEDNTDYAWTVTAIDARGLESAASVPLSFRVNTVNDLPGTPTIVSPEDGATVDTAHPELVVTPVGDNDGDVLDYRFVLSPDESFDTILESAGVNEPDAADGLIHHTVLRELEEDTAYHWRSAAYDGRNLGGFVQAELFVNEANDPPAVPTFQSPSSGERVASVTPELRVRNSSDPESDAIYYDFELYVDDDRSDLVYSRYAVPQGDDGETAVTVAEPLEDGQTYHVRARALDEYDAASDWTPLVRFTVQVAPPLPEPPTPLSPSQGDVVASDDVELTVANSTTGDPALTYAFAVYSDELLTRLEYEADGIPQGEEGRTVHLVTVELPDGTLYWHARVTGGGLTSRWSDTASFVVEEPGSGDLIGGDAGGSPDAGVDAGGDTVGAEPEVVPDDGCGCRAAGGTADAVWLGLVLLGLVGRRRGSAASCG